MTTTTTTTRRTTETTMLTMTACGNDNIPGLKRHKFWVVVLAMIGLLMVSNFGIDLVSIRDSVMFKQQQHQEQQQQPPSLSGVLFVIFCGGEHGKAHMDAILSTWGRKVERALILSNTPEDLPFERFHDDMNHQIRRRHSLHNATTTKDLSYQKSWKVQYESTLEGGPLRDPLQFWNETIQIIHQEIENDQSIRWIVRSDSDTWWNVHRLYKKLNFDHLLPHNKTSMMGQFFPLVDLHWVKRISSRKTTKFDVSDGRDAYLSGGSGVVFARAAIERFYTCLQQRQSTDTEIQSHGKEDVWLSTLAYYCNVTLVRDGGMYQFNYEIPKSKAKSMLSVHKVAPYGRTGRKGYRHPTYYENAIQNISYSELDIISS